MDIKPIETIYNGYRFRSRLEARWAVFFDAIGARYEYEPQGFEFDDGTRYLPDFYLPDCDRWIEVKGVMTDTDKHKIEMFRNYLEAHGKTVLVVVGAIPPETNDLLDYFYSTYPKADCFDVGFDFPYIPCVCPHCGRFGFEFDGRGGRICDHYGCDEKGYSYDNPRILEAYKKARQARFEHGETPT